MNESISNDHVREVLYDRMPTSAYALTFLSGGINRLRNEIFQVNNGMRPAAERIPRVAIVISDGNQNVGGDDNTAIAAAELLRTEKDVKLFAIGVEPTDHGTMLGLVGGESSRVAYGGWSDLADLGLSATAFACDVCDRGYVVCTADDAAASFSDGATSYDCSAFASGGPRDGSCVSENACTICCATCAAECAAAGESSGCTACEAGEPAAALG